MQKVMLFWLLPTLNPRVWCWNVCGLKSQWKRDVSLFSSLRTKLNEIYYYYYYDILRRVTIMVVTAMMMMMMLMMLMMNCDSCCLTVPLTTLLTGAQVKEKKNNNKKKNPKSLNKSLRAAWPSIVCPAPRVTCPVLNVWFSPTTTYFDLFFISHSFVY